MKLILSAFFLIGSLLLAPAQHPILPDFHADPSARVFNGKLYLYPSHDAPGATNWSRMVDWHAFSSGDLKTWTDHGVIFGLKDISWAKKEAWAADCIERNGKFYFYFTAGGHIGVAVADSPSGSFKDALGEPLVKKGEADIRTMIDPNVFMDDDGQAYLYVGGSRQLGVVKLKADMITRDGPIQVLEMPKYYEGIWVHKRNGIYYASYPTRPPGAQANVMVYSMAKSPFGPWEYKGAILDNRSHNVHGSITEFQGKWYLFYHVEGPSHWERRVCVERLAYNEDGTIKPIQMPSTVRDVSSTNLLSAFTTASLAADGGFLFVTFKGEQTPMSEQIYFAVSEDGRKWEELNNSQPVLISTLGDKGVRDPFLLRASDRKIFYLLATDLSVHFNQDWKRHVREGSKSIVIWESTNLVQWTAPRLVKVAPDDAGCTWAPEAVFDAGRKEYLVFWASTSGSDDFSKQRIWASWTRDFVTFGKPFIYIEKPWHVIDTDIVREGQNYYRFSKDEQNKSITLEVSTNLLGPWTGMTNFSLAKMQGYEGPECYQIKPATNGKPASWCLILDHYRAHSGYEPFVTENLSGGKFKPGEGFSFPFRFRHGSVLPITVDELKYLKASY